MTKGIDKATELFSDRFSKLLAPKAPFDTGKYQTFAESMFSNLIGGIGYFYGDAVVDRSYAPEYDEENEGFAEETEEARGRGNYKYEGPSELYTSIPSRPFFPRGFYWDEGFHLLPIAEWDMDLTSVIQPGNMTFANGCIVLTSSKVGSALWTKMDGSRVNRY